MGGAGRRKGKRPLIKLSSTPDQFIEASLSREREREREKDRWLMRNRCHDASSRERGHRVFPSLSLSLLVSCSYFFLFLPLFFRLPFSREMFNKNSSRAWTGRKCRRWSARRVLSRNRSGIPFENEEWRGRGDQTTTGRLFKFPA